MATVKNPEFKSSNTTRGGSGTTRGVEHPISEDMALSGDTKHVLHTKALPKQEHPYKAHQNKMPNGMDPNMLRADGDGDMC